MIAYHGSDIDFSIQGKTAIITGAAAGIGYATARFFAQKGANVMGMDKNPQIAALMRELGKNCCGFYGDVTDAGSREAVIQETLEKFGTLDILVNCAGIVALDRAESLSEDMWDRTMEINLKASFMMAQAVGNQMISNRKGGCIVNMASQAGVVALDRHVAYCAAKGGIIAMTKVMAYEWGKAGIRVNAVSPTVVLTELGRKAWNGEVGEAFKKKIPSERFAEPDEIAGTIAFLCSGAAAMITGHNLLIDGGYTIQ